MTAIRTAAASGAPARPHLLARLTVALLLLTVAIDALYVLGLIVFDRDNNPVVNVGLAVAAQWFPVAVFWLVAARTGFRRVPVILAAAAVTLSATGDAYYSLAMDADGHLPFPSPADAGYLSFYPLMAAALVVLVRAQLRGVGRLVLLEIAVATVGASAVLALVLDPVIGSALANGSVVDNLISVSYPLFDLVLLAVIAGVAAVPNVSLGARSWALITGLAIFAVADVGYALIRNSYIAGTPLDATWAVGLGFMSWWVVGVVTPRDPAAVMSPRAFPVSLPSIAVVAGIAVLIVGTRTPVSLLPVVLAALTVGLGAVPIIFRQAMLGRMLAAQREAVRRLTALDQAKSDILVTINHEFRTPLTSITGHVELLLDGGAGDLPPAATAMLQTIERNAERLQRLVDDAFTASQFEEGRVPAFRERVDVAGLVANAVARCEPLAAGRSVRLVADLAAATLAVEGEPEHLERALAKLVDNAVKFSQPGGRVSVTVEGSDDGRDAVILIGDEGIGIPADDIPRLFTRFFRASNVQSAAIPGVGLGLCIAQQIVRAHDGSIAVNSGVGHGTTMTVRLPLAPA